MLPVLAWDNLGQAPAGWASHVMVRWSEFEPRRGQYNYNAFERALSKRDRPCFLQLGFSMFDKSLGAPQNYTPEHYGRGIELRAASGKSGFVPDYGPEWTDAYSAAVRALGHYYQADPLVAGYWHAAGWNQETQPAADNPWGAWAVLLRPRLPEAAYLASLRASTLAALEAWAGKPVYLPGAPSPGSVWGHRRRDVIAGLLEAGAGYMNCGLQTDNDTSFGIGGHAGRGMYDIVQGRTARVGFEEGNLQARGSVDEVYWCLLRARRWNADFVTFYASRAAPQAVEAWPRLPAAEARWIVFRDAEFPPVSYISVDGTVYGHQGEPGPWGRGIVWSGPGRMTFQPKSFGYDRWSLACDELRLGLPDWPGGRAKVTAWLADGTQMSTVVDVAAGAAGLPEIGLPGDRYHRVDVTVAAPPVVEPEPLTLEQRVARLETWATAHDPAWAQDPGRRM